MIFGISGLATNDRQLGYGAVPVAGWASAGQPKGAVSFSHTGNPGRRGGREGEHQTPGCARYLGTGTGNLQCSVGTQSRMQLRGSSFSSQGGAEVARPGSARHRALRDLPAWQRLSRRCHLRTRWKEQPRCQLRRAPAPPWARPPASPQLPHAGVPELLGGTFRRCFGRSHAPGRTGGERWATAKPQADPRSVRVLLTEAFSSTSKQNAGLCNTGDEEGNAAFFFLEKKCCEIVQEQPPVSTLSPASRSFYITGLTELGPGVRVGVRVRGSQRRNGGLGPFAHLQLLPPHRSPSGHTASAVTAEGVPAFRPASPPPHTPVQLRKTLSVVR